MVVGNIGKFLYGLVQFIFRPKFIEVGTFVLQGVEVPFHRGIVVWVSGFAHALGHMDGFAEFYKSLRCVLAPLVAVQDQTARRRMLGIQGLPQGADGQVAGDVPVRYAGHHAPVIEVYDGAVVPDISILQEQICEIRTPFLVRPVRMEILFQLIPEHLMWLPGLCPGLFGTDNRMQTLFDVHIFMDGRLAVAVASALQIGPHAAVAVHSAMAVVDFVNLFLGFCFLGIITRLPVFPVVIVGIRTYLQPSQQPADAEFLIMLVNEPVSP